jgi:hypothetical protein
MRQTATLAAAFLLLSCESSPTEPRSATLVVSTEKAAYSLSTDYGATPMLVNLGPDTIFAPMNEYVYVEKQTAGGWSARMPWFVVDGIDISFPVPPGDTLTALTMDFGYVSQEPGVYRFVFEVAYDSRGRRLIPETETATPPFELTP